MSPLWVVPLCVLAVGSVALAVALGRLAHEVAAARPALAALRELGADARAAASDVDATRRRGASMAGVRDRLRAPGAALREARRARNGR